MGQCKILKGEKTNLSTKIDMCFDKGNQGFLLVGPWDPKPLFMVLGYYQRFSNNFALLAIESEQRLFLTGLQSCRLHAAHQAGGQFVSACLTLLICMLDSTVQSSHLHMLSNGVLSMTRDGSLAWWHQAFSSRQRGRELS